MASEAQKQLMATTASKQYTFGLLGERVDYSRSPEIFQSIFAADNVSGSFEIINCPVECLSQRLHDLQDSGYDALSVTIPHKESIVPFLYKTDKIADALRSVNSIKFTDSGPCGLNTDVYGFIQPLLAYAGELKGKTAIVLGAGGAARSVAYGLALDCEIAEIQFFSRSEERLAKTAALLADIFPRLQISAVVWEPHDKLPAVANSGIVVNATPLGGPNSPLAQLDGLFASFPRGSLFCDLNYNGDSVLRTEAQQHFRLALDGLPMLIHQALRSYYLWTGHRIQYNEIFAQIEGNAK